MTPEVLVLVIVTSVGLLIGVVFRLFTRKQDAASETVHPPRRPPVTGQRPAPARQVRRTIVGQAQVRDGDSLTIHGTEIRLWGVDAPELRQPDGTRARNALRSKIGLSPVRCQEAGGGRDRYGRVLARCYTTADGTELNRWLVQHGLAHAYTRYTWRYRVDEIRAKRAKRGIWKRQTPQHPEDFRRNRPLW